MTVTGALVGAGVVVGASVVEPPGGGVAMTVVVVVGLTTFLELEEHAPSNRAPVAITEVAASRRRLDMLTEISLVPVLCACDD